MTTRTRLAGGLSLGVLALSAGAAVRAQETPAPRALVAATAGHPLGCGVAGVLDRELLRRYTGAVEYEAGGVLPSAAVRALAPRFSTVSVIGPEGACAPRLGAPRFVIATAGEPLAGQRVGGCGPRVASLALLDCEVPDWLRYRALEAHIERLPRAGVLPDPDLEALAQRPMPFVAATEGESASARRARVRRRVRRSSVRTEREELRVLELHRYLEGAHPCEHAESVEVSVAVRRVDRDPPGPWAPLTPVGRVVGAYLDDAGWVVGLDTVQSPREGHCEVGPPDVLTCDLLAMELRDGTTIATSAVGYTMNATFRGATSLLAHARECRETGY